MGRLPSRLPVYPFGDNEKLQFGAGADYSLYFDGTRFKIDSGTHEAFFDLETANTGKLYLGTASGDRGYIYANLADGYPYIDLVGNGDVTIASKSGADVMLADGAGIRLQMDGGNNNININNLGVSNNYDLQVGGTGILCLKEGATPTADTNYGKVYCKNNDRLYFQDGAGAEHSLAFV